MTKELFLKLEKFLKLSIIDNRYFKNIYVKEINDSFKMPLIIDNKFLLPDNSSTRQMVEDNPNNYQIFNPILHRHHLDLIIHELEKDICFNNIVEIKRFEKYNSDKKYIGSEYSAIMKNLYTGEMVERSDYHRLESLAVIDLIVDKL